MIQPTPKRVSHIDGAFKPVEPLPIVVADGFDERCRRVIERWARRMPVQCRMTDSPSAGHPAIQIAIDDRHSADQSFELDIMPDLVMLESTGPTGAFYGLNQLAHVAAKCPDHWPCQRIYDAPDLPVRGLSLDVSRGKVPTLETLFELVDRLADWRINHLQLYVEHTFDFAFDPTIAEGSSPLAPEDVTALDAYCRDRFIELVPSLSTFGHMGRVLSLPQYRHLAEIEAGKPWEEQSWLERTRGLTIDTRNPESRRLLERMLDEYLPLFSSNRVNVNADETHDLGRGRNREYCASNGRGRLYVDHLKFLAGVCRRHGKRMMLWGDIIRGFPELLDELPQDAVLLDWGYEADAEFPVVACSARGQREVFVCPGTSGWNRVVNAMTTAEANIDRAVTAAKEHGATGMVVTDWGDHGHFNLLSCSLPGIAEAAMRAWDHRGIDRDVFGAGISVCMFGRGDVELMRALRAVSRVGDRLQTWCTLYTPIRELTADDESPARIGFEEAEALQADARRAISLLNRGGGRADLIASSKSIAFEEWGLACEASALIAKKMQLIHAYRAGRADHSRARSLANDTRAFADRYSRIWLRRNRPHRLEDVTGVLENLAVEIAALANGG